MIRTYKYRLYPSPAQAQQLAEWMDFACDLYNAALQVLREAYKRAAAHRDGKGGKLVREWRVWDDDRKVWRWTTQAPPSPSVYELSKDFTQFRQENPDAYPAGMASLVQREVLTRVDRAFQRFFAMVKEGRRAGPPRYRSRRRYDSLTFGLTAPSRPKERFDAEGKSLGVSSKLTVGAGSIRDGALHLTGLGTFPLLASPRRRGAQQARRVHGLRNHRTIPEDAIPRSVIVSRSCGRWYACVALELPDPVASASDRPDCGIDLGVITWATLYSEDQAALTGTDADLSRQTPSVRHLRDGNAIKVDGARAAERHAGRVRRWQRTIARRTRRGHKHSHRRAKAVAQYAKAKESERNVRADHRHKVTRIIAEHFGRIGMEDLGIKEMTRAPKNEPDREGPARVKEDLDRRILDQAWYLLRLAQTYKAEGAGGEVRTTPRFEPTTSRCSACGKPVPMPPSLRWFSCPHCGHNEPRTANSARNVLLLMRAGVMQEQPDGAHPSGDNGSGRGLRTGPSPRPARGPTTTVRPRRGS